VGVGSELAGLLEQHPVQGLAHPKPHLAQSLEPWSNAVHQAAGLGKHDQPAGPGHGQLEAGGRLAGVIVIEEEKHVLQLQAQGQDLHFAGAQSQFGQSRVGRDCADFGPGQCWNIRHRVTELSAFLEFRHDGFGNEDALEEPGQNLNQAQLMEVEEWGRVA